MPMEFWTVAISVFGSALTAFGVAWLTGRNQRPVTVATANQQNAAATGEIAEAAADVSSASVSLYDRLSKRLTEVEALLDGQSKTIATLQSQQIVNVARINFLTDRVATLTTGVRVLSNQIVEMGGSPRWLDPIDPVEPAEGSEYVNPD